LKRFSARADLFLAIPEAEEILMRHFARSLIVAAAIATMSAITAIVGAGIALAQQPVVQTAPPPSEPLKQIALTDKQIESLLTSQKEMDTITDKLPEGAADKPDPKLQAQFDAIVKKNGFADFSEYGAVYDNVSLVMSGIDPKTKAFTQPPEMLKKQIAMVQADPKIPAKDKKAILDEMNDAMKTVAPVQFPANIALVTKYLDKLGPLLQDDQ
jgi:hypothetical protein